MKASNVILILLASMLLTIGICIFAYSFIVVTDVRKIPVTLQVKGNGGFNLDHDALHFGGGSPTDELIRGITLTTKEDRYVLIKATGPVSAFISTPENNFFLKAGESRTVEFTAKIPYDAQYGWYNGTLLVYFKRWNI